jgi:hypothetical protein
MPRKRDLAMNAEGGNTPLDGTVGLCALYGETLGIAICLALFSVLRAGAAVEVLAPWKRRRRYATFR